MLEINISALAVSTLIGVLLLILNRVFFHPIEGILEKRKTNMKNLESQFAENIRKIEQKTLAVEKKIKESRVESEKIKDELIKKGESVRKQMILDTREKAKRMFDEKMKLLDHEISITEQKLEQQIDLFSNKIKEIFI